ncbi:MAG: hypothetical protein ABSD71_15685 [Bacteroidales bacterium]|jgi:hypothetical protein
MVALEGLSIRGCIVDNFGGVCHLGLLGRWPDTHSHRLASSTLDSQVGLWVRCWLVYFYSKLWPYQGDQHYRTHHVETQTDFELALFGLHRRIVRVIISVLRTAPTILWNGLLESWQRYNAR